MITTKVCNLALPVSQTLPIAVTTSVGKRSELIQVAQSIAAEINASYFPRENKGLPWIFEQSGAERLIIVETPGLALVHKDGTIYRYHPNLGLIRALNILRGQRDLFADAVLLNPGGAILDCTLGFACEAILSSILVGESGRVIGLESVPELAYLTRFGLKNRIMTQPRLNDPMRRIEVVCADYVEYIKKIKQDEFDVIYFDPFFNQRIDGSGINIDPLLRFGNPAPLNIHSLIEAVELAGHRVVLKHPRDFELTEQLLRIRSRLIARKHGPVAYSVFEKVDLHRYSDTFGDS